MRLWALAQRWNPALLEWHPSPGKEKPTVRRAHEAGSPSLPSSPHLRLGSLSVSPSLSISEATSLPLPSSLFALPLPRSPPLLSRALSPRLSRSLSFTDRSHFVLSRPVCACTCRYKHVPFRLRADHRGSRVRKCSHVAGEEPGYHGCIQQRG